MISNPFNEYYVNQAGSGIAGYSGVKFQKGYGFFGRLLSTIGLPILKYLGKSALKTGIGVGSDLSGENIKDSVKKRLKSTGFDIVEDAAEKIKSYRQQGSGRRRRRMGKRRQTKKKAANKKRSGKKKLSLLQLRALAKGRKSLKKRRRRRKRKTSEKFLF